jgi:hypothetical protein
MTDWKSIAKARQLNIPAADLERIAAPLEILEKAFRPLVKTIPHEVEPAILFQAVEDGE